LQLNLSLLQQFLTSHSQCSCTLAVHQLATNKPDVVRSLYEQSPSHTAPDISSGHVTASRLSAPATSTCLRQSFRKKNVLHKTPAHLASWTPHSARTLLRNCNPFNRTTCSLSQVCPFLVTLGTLRLDTAKNVGSFGGHPSLQRNKQCLRGICSTRSAVRG
jgi:hypothetical protein